MKYKKNNTNSLTSHSLKAYGFYAQLYKGIFGDDGNTDFLTKMFHSNCVTYQYLISKGYDLPNYLLGGKTLHECGLCIYEEKK
jgi:hypothetical protein